MRKVGRLVGQEPSILTASPEREGGPRTWRRVKLSPEGGTPYNFYVVGVSRNEPV